MRHFWPGRGFRAVFLAGERFSSGISRPSGIHGRYFRSSGIFEWKNHREEISRNGFSSRDEKIARNRRSAMSNIRTGYASPDPTLLLADPTLLLADPTQSKVRHGEASVGRDNALALDLGRDIVDRLVRCGGAPLGLHFKLELSRTGRRVRKRMYDTDRTVST